MLMVDVTGQTKAVSLGSVVMVGLINTATELSHHFCAPDQPKGWIDALSAEHCNAGPAMHT